MVAKFADLKHVERKLPDGGHVYVLNRGATITSEDEAMLQALHSRSTGGFKAHIEKLAQKGSGGFMNRFYVGYGHKSIGDCGDTTVFVDGVSMLTAKAIQDFSLYSGQEASTRYIDFSQQHFLDPTDSDQGREILQAQRDFYLALQEPTREALKEKHSIGEGEKEKTYDKAIAARAFDITRSLLPAGAHTNVAWHGNLRQMADRLLWLRHHPLEEVRTTAIAIEDALAEHHPHSFDTSKRYEATEAYQDFIARNYLYHDPNSPKDVQVTFNVNREELETYGHLFSQRPPKTELPKFLGHLGTVDVRFQLDFGSFRDIQRHRAILQRMPKLTTELGFNEWYLENFPAQSRGEVEDHLGDTVRRIGDLNLSPEMSQYFTPMGFNTSNRFVGDIPATVYMVELRNSRFVHPTLQRVAQSIERQLVENLAIRINSDPQPGRFDVRRGEQDIALK